MTNAKLIHAYPAQNNMHVPCVQQATFMHVYCNMSVTCVQDAYFMQHATCMLTVEGTRMYMSQCHACYMNVTCILQVNMHNACRNPQ